MDKKALILSDKRPGHFNQSIALLADISEIKQPPALLELPKPRKTMKHLALLASLAAINHPTLLRFFFHLYYRTRIPEKTSADLVVSTGGDTLLANIIVSAVNKAPNIFIGKRSLYTRKAVRLLFTSTGTPIQGREVVLPFGPINEPKEKAPEPEVGNISIAVLIGGNSNEYIYREEDYLNLTSSLNKLCDRTDARLLITTSRRTDPAGEAVIRSGLNPAFVEDATWYQKNPRPTSKSYCSRATAIFCSEDSGSMLIEAIMWGKPVVAFRPERYKSTPFYDEFLERLKSFGVQFYSISALSDVSIYSLPTAARPSSENQKEAVRALLFEQ